MNPAISNLISTLLQPHSEQDDEWLNNLWDGYCVAHIGPSLNARRQAWAARSGEATEKFFQLVQLVSGGECKFCRACYAPGWEDAGAYDVHEEFLCESCTERATRCDGCEDLYRDELNLWSVGNLSYCEGCRDDNCTWCESCEEWYLDGDSNRHDHGDCDCKPPRPQFWFPANGFGKINADERLHVELPAGVIDDLGIADITARVCLALELELTVPRWSVKALVHELDPRWQTKRGNFTRRLSSELYKRHKVKLPKGIIAEIGNIARRHSSETANWLLEFTRDLNKPPEAFYNDDSCWWGGNSNSRCALKQWGGLGMRSYSGVSDNSDDPAGRVWIQPLDETLQPTHDAMGAHAYVVYNGYGNLEGIVAARLVAHLTSRTYRRISCVMGSQYVNSNIGYLVADQATCDKTEKLTVSDAEHHQFDADDLQPEAVAA